MVKLIRSAHAGKRLLSMQVAGWLNCVRSLLSEVVATVTISVCSRIVMVIEGRMKHLLVSISPGYKNIACSTGA